VEKMSSYWKNQ